MNNYGISWIRLGSHLQVVSAIVGVIRWHNQKVSSFSQQKAKTMLIPFELSYLRLRPIKSERSQQFSVDKRLKAQGCCNKSTKTSALDFCQQELQCCPPLLGSTFASVQALRNEADLSAVTAAREHHRALLPE